MGSIKHFVTLDLFYHLNVALLLSKATAQQMFCHACNSEMHSTESVSDSVIFYNLTSNSYIAMKILAAFMMQVLLYADDVANADADAAFANAFY